ncbi:XdhC family protein [Streptomyces sp. NPDC051018]|uniref:XdhC family protein n=1 Tax=Streptomyces sp. NPDC051018 TaxID=3365639 RepID=UPI0037B8765B
MLDIAEGLNLWAGQGKPFAVATVVAVGGSAPRQPGAALAVDGEGAAIGSVSGGCVEGAVYELCRQALRDGRTVRERFGYDDGDAFAVGLTCGGVIDILVTPVPAPPPGSAGEKAGGRAPVTEQREVVARALSAAARGESAALVRVVEGPGELLGRALFVRPGGAYEGTLGGRAALDRAAAGEAAALLDAGRTGTVVTGVDGGRCGGALTLLVESSVPPPRMIVFGAVDFASALVGAGKFLGHHVTVCDARPVFATRDRFPGADEVVVDWPHRYLRSTGVDSRTVLCVLTHDAKFDVPLLELALRLPVAYVGAMGSRRTHEDRVRRLREAGVTERELAGLHSPIGLDLGARTPEETALSIAAEIVAVRRGGSGVPLTGARTPIHHETADPGARAEGSGPRTGPSPPPGSGEHGPGPGRGKPVAGPVVRAVS